MSVPDRDIDLPGDPYCGACGCCHAVGDQGHGCTDEHAEERVGEAIDAAELAQRTDRSTGVPTMTPSYLLEEDWKDIPGLEGRYRVSNLGRVFSLLTLKIMKPCRQSSKKHYLVVPLCGPLWRRHRNHFIHRLVLTAFVGPCPPGRQGAHLNGKPTDNRLENLTWATYRENQGHKAIHGTMATGERVGSAKLTIKQVAESIVRHRNGESCGKIARDYAVSPTTIQGIVAGRQWKRALTEAQ